MALPFLKNHKLKKSELISCRYSVGGGMLGGHSSSTLRKDDNGNVTYVSEYAETHADRIVTKTYQASEEDLENIKNLILRYNLYAASKKGPSPFQVLDGDTATLSIDFSDGEYFSVSESQNLSKHDYEAMSEIARYLSSLAKGEASVEIEKHLIAVLIDGYQIGYSMEECEAVEQLLNFMDEYDFYDYENVAKAITLDVDLDISGLKKTDRLNKGDICYVKDNRQILFVYENTEVSEDIYVIGQMENLYDSSIELIRNMEDKPYVLMARK